MNAYIGTTEPITSGPINLVDALAAPTGEIVVDAFLKTEQLDTA